jgi:hypothetical protein
MRRTAGYTWTDYQKNNSSRDETHEKNSRIHLDRLLEE